MGEQPIPDNSWDNSKTKKPLGEILVEAGLVSIHQIEIALIEQKQYNLRIGELIASHGWIKQETADFFVVQWPSLLQSKQRRPLALYLFAAGLLDREQLLILKQKQKETTSETRLHTLAVEQGYVQQVTVNFFLKYLFNIDSNEGLYFVKPYEIIKNYINGKTNFQGLELSQVTLNGVSLKQIVLDGSILIKANLNNSNLAHSSLVKTNLMFADLELANLAHINFRRACLIEANLQHSNLKQANFRAAILQEANLRGANLEQASFVAADLRGAKLDSACSYDVYYDDRTCFDNNFNPIQAGWKKVK